jgi:hypothetical protein
MVVVFENENKTLDYTNYTGGQVETVRGVSQSELEHEFRAYDSFKYYSVSPQINF